MLEYAKTLKKLEIFFYFSTDEAFGPAPKNFAIKNGIDTDLQIHTLLANQLRKVFVYLT